VLIRDGVMSRVAVIDLDAHQGNGRRWPRLLP
jgi:acetoin utilization deacetylase AcuC-like enzyme